MSIHSQLYDAALKAARALFDDTSVPQQATRDSLEELREEIDTLISFLPEEGKNPTGSEDMYGTDI